jgi:hypothetical protein
MSGREEAAWSAVLLLFPSRSQMKWRCLVITTALAARAPDIELQHIPHTHAHSALLPPFHRCRSSAHPLARAPTREHHLPRLVAVSFSGRHRVMEASQGRGVAWPKLQ